MLSSILTVATLSSLVACSVGAPLSTVTDKVVAQRQYIDYGPPPPVNCTVSPSSCPTNGPSGYLNYPVGGQVLTTHFDNSGYVDVSYTPVNQGVGDSGSVHTTSVIFTLREYFYGVPAFSDSIIILGQLGVPDDFSTITARLSLPGRFYDGDSSDEDDVTLSGSGGDSSVGEWAFQVVEQQSFLAASGATPTLIEFYSAAPLINITYVGA